MNGRVVRGSRLRSVLSGVALLAACLVFVGGASAGVAGTVSFTDPAGDAAGGPDVTGVTVRGDAGTGQISFSVNVPGYPLSVDDGLERHVDVWIDTDRNSTTGDPEDGAEVGLQAWVDPTGRWWFAGRWNGSAYGAIPQATTSFARGGNVLTWTLSMADLGSTSFRFYVNAGTWNEAEKRSVARDEAPNVGWWDYDVSTTTTPPPSKPPTSSVKLMVDAPKASPKEPAVGARFTLSFDVKLQKTESVTVIDITTGQTRESLIVTWEPLARGTAVSNPTIAGRALPRTVTLRNGVLRISLVVPKTAKGKLLKVPVKIGATASGKTLSATRVVIFRVK